MDKNIFATQHRANPAHTHATGYSNAGGAVTVQKNVQTATPQPATTLGYKQEKHANSSTPSYEIAQARKTCKQRHPVYSRAGTQARKTYKQRRHSPQQGWATSRKKNAHSDAPAYNNAGAQARKTCKQRHPAYNKAGPSHARASEAWCSRHVACVPFASRREIFL